MTDQTSGGAIGGFHLTARTRVTELGAWIDAIGPEGDPAGALRFDPVALGGPGVRDRVVAAVLTDRRLAQAGLRGLIPVDDLVAAGDEIWLLTRQAAGPSLADLISWRGLDPASAAAVLAETARTLLALHAAGVAHGSFHQGTVVITADGTPLLTERGLADALHDRPGSPARDVAAWAALSHDIAAASAPQAAGLFTRAAATARAHGLTAARAVLLAGEATLGSITHTRLALAARAWPSLPSAACTAPPPGLQARPTPPPSTGGPSPDEGDIATLLHVQEPTVWRSGPDAERPSTAEQLWRTGRPAATAPTARRRGRVHRLRTITAAITLAALLTAALLVWTTDGRPRADPIEVTGVRLLAPKKIQDCTEPIRVRARVSTNGQAGTVTYEWRQSDSGQRHREQQAIPAGETSWTVAFLWSLEGHGNGRLAVVFRLLSPPVGKRTLEARAGFSYAC